MGLMEKMRNSTTIILWVLIGSFGLLWVMADVNFFDAISAGPNSLGSVNGENISNEEYQSRIQYYSNAYSQQTGNSMNSELRAYYETQVWDELVTSRLISQKMDEIGITVSDQEVLDRVYGDNPAPFIRQYFTREDGTIDRAAIQQVLSSSEFSQQAIALELQLREEIRQQKLNSYISSGIQVTDKEIEAEYIRENSTAHIQYVRFPYSEVAESELEVSESDLQNYYKNNRERYKRDQSYRFRYVTFSILPTASDTAEIVQDLERLRADFAQADNDSLFLARYGSATAYRSTPVNRDDIRDEYRPVLDVGVGEVTDVILTANQALMLKKTGQQGNQISFQIMSYNIEPSPATIDGANDSAADFEFYASEESDFLTEAEARGLEVHEAFATKGNDFISGLGSSRQIMNFLEKAKEGRISEVIELPSSFLVLEVMEISQEGYRPFEEVRMQVETLVKNERRKELTAAKVSEIITRSSGLQSIAENAGKEVQSNETLRASASVIPGAGREPQIIGAAFVMQEGSTSGALTGNAAAFVVHVVSKNEADPANMTEEQKSTIYQRLEQQKFQLFSSVWIDQLREDAKIVDNRSRLLQ